IYLNDEWGSWDRIRLVPRRPKESVFLRGEMMDTILADARRFFQDPLWYIDRGLPHRRGYLLHGPPGNGKSTVIQALATELGTPIYVLSLQDPKLTDAMLARALGRVPAGCLVVIEDFEKIRFEPDSTGVTMPGLLNCVDGPMASDGRILVITANMLDPIPDAMLRPGRVDRRWELGLPNAETVQAMAARFYPARGRIHNELLATAAVREGWSVARVQQEFLIQEERDGRK
ncbi:MAG: AAA family ATPase, partial [Nitrospiraceae bacterium]